MFSKNNVREMCQHIYNTPNKKRNEVNLSIARMAYVEVELGK
jgi:hypothetical protein